jgi:DNA-binding transcriptional LysR family regulator
LRQVSLALAAPSKFVASTATRSFRLTMTDFSTVTSLPRLTTYLRGHAKGIDLRVTSGGSSTSLAQLLSGEADLALGVFPRIMPGLKSQELYRDELVCVVDRKHKKLAGGQLKLKDYLACPHIQVATDKDTGMEIDDILDGLGLKRRVMITIPHFSSVPELVRGTDLIGHVRRGFSSPSSPNLKDFCIFKPPLPRQVPQISFMQVWHEKNDTDRAHKWLRQAIITCCAQQEGSP